MNEMTREIKFRIWDGKEMQNVGVIDLDDSRSMDYYNWHDGYAGEYYSFKEHPLMQYTGLNDRQGKPIFEGDIIETVQGTRFVVKWNQANCQWCIETDGTEYALAEYMIPNIWIEGNIYETP